MDGNRGDRDRCRGVKLLQAGPEHLTMDLDLDGATSMTDDAGPTAGSELEWRHWREAAVLFLRGATVRAAWPTAAVVGTVLSVVNQGDVVISGGATLATWLRIAFNYAVPFVVASTGFLSAYRRGDQGVDD